MQARPHLKYSSFSFHSPEAMLNGAWPLLQVHKQNAATQNHLSSSASVILKGGEFRILLCHSPVSHYTVLSGLVLEAPPVPNWGLFHISSTLCWHRHEWHTQKCSHPRDQKHKTDKRTNNNKDTLLLNVLQKRQDCQSGLAWGKHT